MGESAFILNGGIPPNPLRVYGRTDKGMVRSHNEDYFGYFQPADENIKEKWGSLFAVSDGVGGNAAGEVASAEAVNVLLQEYYFGDHAEKLPDRLKNAYEFSAIHIYDLSCSHRSVRNMQCTLTALLLRQNRFFISHVGDSRAYLLRSNKLIQLTKDHTFVGKLVRLGLITPEAAESHPYKHLLLMALGERPILSPDFHSGYVMPGDLFCLITDGIREHMTEEELRLALLEEGDMGNTLDRLVEKINKRGGSDNMTILVVKVGP